VISSEEGLQQGDPLAPALFCLSIHHAVEQLQSRLNAWFLDDGALGDAASIVLDDLMKLIPAFEEIGLSFNDKKCEMYVFGDSSHPTVGAIAALLPEVKFLDQENVRLLGAPLNIESFPGSFNPKIKEISRLVDRLPLLPSHIALFLLRHCLAIPKLTYLLRCTTSWKAEEFLTAFDTMVRNGQEVILNIRFTDQIWEQSSLPVACGGIGIRSARDLSIPAFLASISGTSSLVSTLVPNLPALDPTYSEALELWKELSGNAVEPQSFRQKDWEFPILELRTAALLESATTRCHLARLRAVSRAESGAWLNALPCPALGTLMDNETVRIAAGLRLGAELCHPHTCRCGAQVDQFGTHGLSCQKNAGRIPRHSAINNIIKQTCASFHVPSILEPAGLFRDDNKAPDGLTQIPWSRGKCLLWDATCKDTLAQSYLPNTSRTAGAAAALAENQKRAKYREVLNQYTFCPFAVETLGPFGEEALSLTRDLGRRQFEATGERRSTAFLFQRISIAIQRGNAASVLATIPPSSKIHEIYNL
jgi:hypothetical protein